MLFRSHAACPRRAFRLGLLQNTPPFGGTTISGTIVVPPHPACPDVRFASRFSKIHPPRGSEPRSRRASREGLLSKIRPEGGPRDAFAWHFPHFQVSMSQNYIHPAENVACRTPLSSFSCYFAMQTRHGRLRSLIFHVQVRITVRTAPRPTANATKLSSQ